MTSKQQFRLILGSSSPWRKRILSQLGYTFDVISPDIDEKAIRDSDPKQLTLKIARAKAEAIRKRISDDDAILITSDQVIVWNGQIREKPRDANECREFLRSYQHSPAEAVDAVVVTILKTGQQFEGVATATQYFHPLPETFIDELISQGDVMKCAGGFTIEHMEPYLKKLEGERETIEGLPKTLTQQLLTKALEHYSISTQSHLSTRNG